MSQLGTAGCTAGLTSLGFGTGGCCIAVSQSFAGSSAAGLAGFRIGTGGCCIAVSQSFASGGSTNTAGLRLGAGGRLPGVTYSTTVGRCLNSKVDGTCRQLGAQLILGLIPVAITGAGTFLNPDKGGKAIFACIISACLLLLVEELEALLQCGTKVVGNFYIGVGIIQLIDRLINTGGSEQIRSIRSNRRFGSLCDGCGFLSLSSKLVTIRKTTGSTIRLQRITLIIYQIEARVKIGSLRCFAADSAGISAPAVVRNSAADFAAGGTGLRRQTGGSSPAVSQGRAGGGTAICTGSGSGTGGSSPAVTQRGASGGTAIAAGSGGIAGSRFPAVIQGGATGNSTVLTGLGGITGSRFPAVT